MNGGDIRKLGKLDKLVKCERCGNRLPTDSEIGELCDRRKLESAECIKTRMEALERKGLAFCVCPERLWQRKPHLVAAVLAVKYPEMNWESPMGKNRTASWIVERLTGNPKNKALTDKERRTLSDFREKGTEILYQWGLEFPEVDIPLIVVLDNLLDNPLFEMGMQEPRTPAEIEKFLREVAENPSLLYMLLKTEITGHVAWPDENPYGYDPDEMKKKLYKEHPEYQAILDGMIDDYSYEECVAAIEGCGSSPYLDECETSEEEAESERARATSPEYQAILDGEMDDEPESNGFSPDGCEITYAEAASELAWAMREIEMDKLRARMIAALRQSLTSKTSK